MKSPGSDKRLTFEQREGTKPLPSQLEPKTLPRRLRVRLFDIIRNEMLNHAYDGEFLDPWLTLLFDTHVQHFERMPDEFENKYYAQEETLKEVFSTGSYDQVLGLIEFILRHRLCRPELGDEIDNVLLDERSAYRIVDQDTVAALGSDEDRQTIELAFADLAQDKFNGAKTHLKRAVGALTDGKYSDSIRESIHAVESVARALEPGANSLSKALERLERKSTVHGALKKGFLALYGFTSSEEGIRHPLLETDSAQVDETDALFMIGACAAFISYLINKVRKTDPD